MYEHGCIYVYDVRCIWLINFFAAVEVHGCKTCTRAFYCSRRCQESHAPLHSMECRALVHLNNFAANVRIILANLNKKMILSFSSL